MQFMVKINLKFPLTVLLPYDTSLDTRNVRIKINEYAFLISSLLKAIELLQKGEFSHFDPLVGDNACHIRALKICTSFSHTSSIFVSKLPKIEHIKKILDLVIERNEIPLDGSLDQFLRKNNLNMELSSDELFILGCYFLTVVKRVLPPKKDKPLLLNETTMPLVLKNFGKISGQFTRNFVNNLRKYMASLSVNYIQQEVQFISDIASEMVSSKFTISHNHLKCISIFWSSFIVMERALRQGIPIFLIADQKATDYDYHSINRASILLNPNGSSYHMANPKTENPNQLGIVIKGTTYNSVFKLKTKKEWVKNLISYQPADLFLAYSAGHRQFPDPTKDHLITETFNPTFEEYRQKSMEWGCCLDNPSLFFVTHVYCEKLGNISNLLSPEEISPYDHHKRFTMETKAKSAKRARVSIGDKVINF
jgi:hypothetical protein